MGKQYPTRSQSRRAIEPADANRARSVFNRAQSENAHLATLISALDDAQTNGFANLIA
jgi:hypothetical protein